MIDESCQQYIEDPEANPGHLDTCVSCRALFARGAAPAPRAGSVVSVEALPLAPWEGAGERSWPLIAAGALLIAAAALALCAAAGTTPLEALASAAGNTANARAWILRSAENLRAASPLIQAGFVLLFVVVNGVFVLMLRRPTRGIDA